MSATATTARLHLRMMTPLLAIVAGLVALGLIFLPECRAAFRVWSESTAYGHCFLVAPISVYLGWERRDRVRGAVPQPSPAFVVLGLPLAVAWFVAERLGIMEGRQLVALGFVELLFLSVLGWRMFRAMLAPLAYLVFMVPFGAFITPVLQSFTARFIDFGLTALDIPHFSNEMFIEIAAGTFFVAEACAGLRFLIAAIAFGVFYALLNYEGAGRRALFIATSIVVPIVANGFRALGIVMLGHFLGSAEAAAADHILYGWVFFSMVMLMLVVGGMALRERGPSLRRPVAAVPQQHRPLLPWPALLVLVLAAIAPAAARALDGTATAPALVRLPVLVAPENCAISQQPERSGTDGPVKAAITCGQRRWSVVLQPLPSRSTAASLVAARTRLVGSLDAENVTVRIMHGLPEASGTWQDVVSEEPPLVAGFSVWIHGAPARGGLWQRFTQARDSVLGQAVPPVLMVISTRPEQVLKPREAEAVVEELGRIVATQTRLSEEIVAVTTPGAR